MPPRGLYIEYQLLSFEGKIWKGEEKRENEKKKEEEGKKKEERKKDNGKWE